MGNVELWEQNKQIEDTVEQMFAESDEKVFAIMHKLVDLAINGDQYVEGSRQEKSNQET